MLSEAIERFQKLAVDAHGPQGVYDDRRTTFVQLSSGELQRFEHDPPSRNHKIDSIGSLSHYEGESSIVWHSGNKVTLIVDDSNRFCGDRVDWDLKTSAKFECLRDKAKTPRDQKSFVSFLVKYLRDEIEAANAGLLGILRNLKFATNDESEGDINHGRESMGRKVRNEVTGAGDLPETIILNVKRWAQLDIFVSVEAMLEVNLDDRTLSLSPMADSIVNANIDAHRQLSDLIREEVKCDVLHGTC